MGRAGGRVAGMVLWVCAMTCAVVAAKENQAVRSWEVDRAWSGHMTAPPVLVTAGGHQYLAHYNAERRLTLAWRQLGGDDWQRRHFPVVTAWATGAHAMVALTVDAEGLIHLIPYRRDLTEAPESPPDVIYFRSQRPHDPGSMERAALGPPDEPRPHYPVFLTAPDGALFLECRLGSSGNGDQVLYRYEPARREWRRMAMLMDGGGRMSAYGGPRLGPDGRWHCLWMWRDTPDAETNHTLCYMTSPDLRTWRNAAGAEITLPVKPENPDVVVDPSPPGQGLLNAAHWLGFDSKHRPVAGYHVYAPCGNSAIYNARFENGAWRRVAAHVWDFRWDFGGRGAIDVVLGASPVAALDGGRLIQRVWSRRHGTRFVILDEATLMPQGEADASTRATHTSGERWQAPYGKPDIQFPARPLGVKWLADRGKGAEPGARYFVRWEHGAVNVGDKPVPQPWPEPAPLRVFRVGP